MRDIRLDNIRGLLIILTVFGHLLEQTSGGISHLYRIIYSFHMPAFIFISGYLAKWKPKKPVFFYLPLYLVTQLIYLIFDALFIGNSKLTLSAFFTPYWHLWYLFSLIFYHLLLPFLNHLQKKGRLIFFIFSILASLALPYIKADLYFMSIGRFFAFLPFFTAGYFLSKSHKAFPDLQFLVPFSVLFVMICKGVSLKMLYGSFSYIHKSDILIRATLILFAFAWISLLFAMPKTSCPLTSIGSNTLPIYILHGFFIRVLKICASKPENSLTALIIAIVLCASLSSLKAKKQKKAVDTSSQKVYNIINTERSFFPWISKQKSKNL